MAIWLNFTLLKLIKYFIFFRLKYILDILIHSIWIWKQILKPLRIYSLTSFSSKMKYFDLAKRLFALCVILVVSYIIVTYKHLRLPVNLSKNIQINILADSANKWMGNFPINSNTKIEAKTCDILRKNYKQYYHEFDGIKYPQYLHLSQNYSIDFDCLNNSSPMKRILAWNKFYGMLEFLFHF